MEKREGGVKIMLFVSVHAHVQADILLYEAYYICFRPEGLQVIVYMDRYTLLVVYGD